MSTKKKQPVISGDAHEGLSRLMRQWSGWKKARLLLVDSGVIPMGASASTTHPSDEEPNGTFRIEPAQLILNPNNVLLTVTPFRLRQEAVLTGAALHEVGHARHSKWQPNRYGNPETLLHSPRRKWGEAEECKPETLAFARLMEEPRVEGLIAAEADDIGAYGLGWTPRATAAHLMPPTELSTDPNQMLMDMIESWTLRAGRQVSYAHNVAKFTPARWVGTFTNLLELTILDHLQRVHEDDDPDDHPAEGYDAGHETRKVMHLINQMICGDRGYDTGTLMIDLARDVLEILFPETSGDDDGEGGGGVGASAPMAGMTGCGDSCGEPEDSEDQGQDAGGSPESDDQGEEEESEGEDSDSPGDGDSEDEQDGEGEGEGEQDQPEQELTPEQEALAAALAAIENAADNAEIAATDRAADEAPPAPPMSQGGSGSGDGNGEWRQPTPEERQMQKGAERFLRELISPAETARRSLVDSPSATVDGAALAAWRAGGEVSEPRFFVRSRRSVEPAPPVKIAVLPDVSASMDILQKPTAQLSWALSAAALDLRNFAGRGVQVESTLIHWGSSARVIQKNGKVLPGLREWDCNEGTTALGEAVELIETEIPGFLGVPDKPVHRLMVLFTDWQIGGMRRGHDIALMRQALMNGVHMLSVMPRTSYRGSLDDVVFGMEDAPGKASLMQYDPNDPEGVWEHAAKMLTEL